MITTWSITQLDRNTADGGVTMAHWSVDAIDEDNSASAYGSVGFTPDASATGFKPYDELTEADVLAWVWANGVDKDTVEVSLTEQIELQKNPVTATGLPW